MVKQELKKLVVYCFFLAILIIPMLGFKGPSFEAGRAFKTLGVFSGILLIKFLVTLIRSRQASTGLAKLPLTERIRGQINRIPKLYSISTQLVAASVYPLFANNYMIDVSITCLSYG